MNKEKSDLEKHGLLDVLRRFRVRRRWRSVLFWLKTVLLFGAVLAIPALMIWLRFAGLGSYAQTEAEKALSRVGIQAKIGRLTLDPINGLTARDVSIQPALHPEWDPIKVRRAVLSVRWSALFKKHLEFERFTIRDGKVTVPLANGRKIKLQDIQATIFFSPGQVRIRNVEFIFRGIRFSALGNFLNPEALQTGNGSSQGTKTQAPSASLSSAQENKDTDALVESILSFLERTEFTGRHPSVEFTFGGNLADLKSLRVETLRIQAGNMRQKNWQILSLHVDGEFAKGILSFPSIEVLDAQGRMIATGEWDIYSGRIFLEMESSLDVRPFLPPDSQPLKDWVFVDSPEFSLRAHLQLTEKGVSGRMTGDLRAGHFLWRDIAFDGFQTSFAWKDGDIYLRNAELDKEGGKLEADFLQTGENFQARLQSNLNPQELFRFADAKARETLDHFVLLDAPVVTGRLWGNGTDFAHLKAYGKIALGKATLRGVEILSATSDVQIEEKAVAYRNLVVHRKEGSGTGTVVYDMGHNECRLEKIVADLNPKEVLSAFDPKMGEAVAPYRFHSPPHVEVNGMIHLRDQSKNRLDVTVDAEKGFDYDLAKKTLPFGHTQGKLTFRGARLDVDLPKAELFSGNVKVKSTVSLDRNHSEFEATVMPERVKFLPLSKLYFNYEKTQGRLSGIYQFRSDMHHPLLMNGKGSAQIAEGNVFAIPVLGALSDLMNAVIPGVGYQSAHLATADFEMKNGVASTQNFEVTAQRFLMQGEGSLDLVNDRMDFAIRINARGVTGILLYPVSKVFEYVSDGSLSEPKWRPRLLPKIP